MQGHTINRQDHPLNVLAVINRASLFAAGLNLDRYLHTIPERASVAEWPDSFSADEQEAQMRYLAAMK